DARIARGASLDEALHEDAASLGRRRHLDTHESGTAQFGDVAGKRRGGREGSGRGSEGKRGERAGKAYRAHGRNLPDRGGAVCCESYFAGAARRATSSLRTSRSLALSRFAFSGPTRINALCPAERASSAGSAYL